jgi:hypothetical protein
MGDVMKIYLDHNLIVYIRNSEDVLLIKLINELKESGSVFLFSPAHLEELAVSEKRSCASAEIINHDLDFLTRICGNHSIRPVDRFSVVFDTEYPRECYNRVVDSYEINDLAEAINQIVIDDAHDNPAGNPKEINNSDPVELFSNIINKELLLRALMEMGDITQLEAISCIQSQNYNVVVNRFCARQSAISYLSDWLEKIGYYRESRNKSRSRMHDVSHIIYGSYSDLIVSNDGKFIKKASSVYGILGLNTNVVSMNDFLEHKFHLSI